MKFIEGVRNRRSILGTQTLFWPLNPPPPEGVDCCHWAMFCSSSSPDWVRMPRVAPQRDPRAAATSCAPHVPWSRAAFVLHDRKVVVHDDGGQFAPHVEADDVRARGFDSLAGQEAAHDIRTIGHNGQHRHKPTVAQVPLRNVPGVEPP